MPHGLSAASLPGSPQPERLGLACWWWPQDGGVISESSCRAEQGWGREGVRPSPGQGSDQQRRVHI